ncbi:hypothetical protein KY333_04085 [Candidatus Woesearchaeota archaeon]|nr:hypothetical protein [Candidatus Woesearchaeota archaeon]MBW2994250.1 hypothetical protein [Candidatus Woesearchaeota archaeon]
MALGLTTAKRVFFIVVLVCIVASLVMIGEFYRTGAISYQPLQQPRQSIGMRLYFADYIYSQVTAIGGGVSDCLRTGTIQTNEGRTDYTQSLQFGVPGDFNGGRLVFKQIKTPTETASAALSWAPGSPIWQYKIQFESGLQSKLDSNNVLDDLRDRRVNIMGTTYTFLSGQSTYNPGSNRIQLRLMGGYGTIDLSAVCNQWTEGGVRVNGKTVDSQLRIFCSQINNAVRIESIEYRPEATQLAPTAEFDVLPKHGVSEYMLYPQALGWSPEVNLFLAQVGSGAGTAAASSSAPAGAGNIVFDGSRKQYRATFSLLRGGTYRNLDIVRANPFGWGSDSGNRDFIVTEGNWIDTQDYFALSAGPGLNDPSWIYMLNKVDTSNNVLYWRDMASGGTKQANYNAATGNGNMNLGGYNFAFNVDAANKRIKVDQNNDGAIGGGTVSLRTADQLLLKFGAGVGDIELRVPWELRQEQNVDEINKMKIVKQGSSLNINVISPQMQDDVSVEGREQGMSQFGLRFVLDTDPNPDRLNIFTSSRQAAPRVMVAPSGGQVAGIILFTCEQSTLAALQR